MYTAICKKERFFGWKKIIIKSIVSDGTIPIENLIPIPNEERFFIEKHIINPGVSTRYFECEDGSIIEIPPGWIIEFSKERKILRDNQILENQKQQEKIEQERSMKKGKL